MLGIDLAGPLSFHLAWTDKLGRFLRVASQSGRFGWGGVDNSPYVQMILGEDRSASMKKLSFDWADTDHFQVAVHDTRLKPTLEALAAYKGKVFFLKQEKVMPMPQQTVWDNWQKRLEKSLSFLFEDLGK